MSGFEIGDMVRIKSAAEFAEYGYGTAKSEEYGSFATPFGLRILNRMVFGYNSQVAFITSIEHFGADEVYRLDIDNGAYVWDEYCFADFVEVPDLTGIEELI